MKKRIISFILALLCVLPVFAACKDGGPPEGMKPIYGAETTGDSESVTETAAPETEPVPEVESLWAQYEDQFYIGVALPDHIFGKWGKYGDDITDNFNSYTCENEMKPDYILDQAKSRANLDETYENAAVKFDAAEKLMKRAKRTGAKVRLHTLVWHSQTPDWFFTEDYTNDGKLVSAGVMLKRMENYIKNVIEYYDTNYPGMIYAIDVVNEAIEPWNGDKNSIRDDDNRWYDTVGPDYIYWAFYYANKYAPDYMKLFYNDYACMFKVDVMLDTLKPMLDEGIIDGIGMQSHLSAGDSTTQFLAAARRFCEAGFELQITEFDIGIEDTSESQLKKQKRAYSSIMSGLVKLKNEGYNVTSVTVWGLNDEFTWRSADHPLLFNADMTKKPAYYGFYGEK